MQDTNSSGEPTSTHMTAAAARWSRLDTLEWAGCALGLSGATLLALNLPVSRYGWTAYLLANVAMIGFARGKRAHGLLVQQLGFMFTTCLGLYRAFGPITGL